MVRRCAFCLVFVEASVGLLVLLGLWTRRALIVGVLTMAAREYNEYSLDGRIAR